MMTPEEIAYESALIDKLQACRAERAELLEALRDDSEVFLHLMRVWFHEEFSAEDVKKSRREIFERGGTIACITDVRERARALLKKLERRPE